MKKLIPLLAVVAALFVGCGKQDTRGSSTDSGAAAGTTDTTTDTTGTTTSTMDTTGTTTTTQTGVNATDPNAPKRP